MLHKLTLTNFKAKIRQLQKDEHGWTPMQIILGSIVIAGLAGAAYSQFETARDGSDDQIVRDEITQIITAADSVYEVPGYPSGDCTASIQPFMPENLKGSSSSIRNKYGASVTCSGSTLNSLPVLGLTYPGVPKRTCEKILLKTAIGGKSRYGQITVNGGSAITATITDPATAATSCSTDRNSFVFSLYQS